MLPVHRRWPAFSHILNAKHPAYTQPPWRVAGMHLVTHDADAPHLRAGQIVLLLLDDDPRIHEGPHLVRRRGIKTTCYLYPSGGGAYLLCHFDTWGQAYPFDTVLPDDADFEDLGFAVPYGIEGN